MVKKEQGRIVETATEARQAVPGPSILLILIVSLTLAVLILVFSGLSSSGPESVMHEAAKLQFERVVREFAQWRAVPEVDRSPAPAWWWQPAFEVMDQQDQMPPQWCQHLELPPSANYAAGASVLMASLADQTSLPPSEEFPRKIHASEKSRNE